MMTGPMLDILEQAGADVLTLTEGLEPEEFFSSHLTQMEALRQIKTMAETVNNLPGELKSQIVEIDWAGWSVLAAQLFTTGGFERDAVWFGVRSLIPATLLWLRVYRKNQPQLFSYAP